jgi:hypothetical protein
MGRKFNMEDATALAKYEPVESEFREHALMVWRTEGKGINMYGSRRKYSLNMYGLRWKYIQLTLEE